MDMDTTVTIEQVREFVIAGHGNLARVKEMLAENPALLNMGYDWADDDRETAIMGAAHVGSPEVAEYLLSQGAPLAIYTAAMLGRRDTVQRMLDDDPALATINGAHGIPLLTHAAWNGDVELTELLWQRGARTGGSSALSNAVRRGHVNLARWLIENTQPDLAWKNFQGKTALELALDNGDERLIALLRTA